MDKKINIHQSIMNNTTNNEFNTLCLMYLIGNDNNKETVLYHKNLYKKLEELKEQGIKVPSKNTIKKYMKTFERITIDGDNFHLMDIINTPKGICYQFKQSYQGKYFITIPSPMLREMHLNLKDNPIKVYCIIARKLQINNDYTKFTREYICNGMGLEPNEGNLNDISNHLKVLKKLGYIKIEYDWIKEKTDSGNKMKQVTYIRLTTFEEWEELTKINKRTNKKTKK